MILFNILIAFQAPIFVYKQPASTLFTNVCFAQAPINNSYLLALVHKVAVVIVLIEDICNNNNIIAQSHVYLRLLHVYGLHLCSILCHISTPLSQNVRLTDSGAGYKLLSQSDVLIIFFFLSMFKFLFKFVKCRPRKC